MPKQIQNLEFFTFNYQIILNEITNVRALFLTLFVLEALYAAVLYFVPPIVYYSTFRLLNFDYGILYNSTELISRFQEPLMSTRGLYAWADNQDYFQILLAPLHFLPNPHYGLLTAHTLAIYSCGLLVGWDLRHTPVLAVLIAPFVWLSPFLLNMNLDLIHTEAFATLWLIAMFFAAKRGAQLWFFVFLALALSCKEDVAITTAWFMVLAWLRPSLLNLPRAIYIAGFALSVAVFTVNQGVVLPHYKVETCRWLSDGFPAHVHSSQHAAPWFGNLAASLRNPEFYTTHFFTAAAAVYLGMLLGPVVPFIRVTFPLTLLPLAGAAVNLIGGGYLIKAAYHYDHSSFAGVIIVLLLGLPRIRWQKSVALLLAIAAIAINLTYRENSIRLTDPFHDAFWQLHKRIETRFIEITAQVLPKDIVISADYTTINYLLKGRSSVYMYENPFRGDYFGVYGGCDGETGALTKVPKADLVVLRGGLDRAASAERLTRAYDEIRVPVGNNQYAFEFFVRRDAPRRDELIAIINELRAYQNNGRIGG